MPSQIVTQPVEPTLFPAEDERVLPGPWRAPSPAMTASIIAMAALMLVGALLLG